MYNRDYLIRASRFLNEDTEERIVADDSNIKEIVSEELEKLGDRANLNHIDVSQVTNMEDLFYESNFNGDISNWDVSNVENMDMMFYKSKFNGDISQWDVSKVNSMFGMFGCSLFNRDISNWNIKNVRNMESMFHGSKFNQDLSNWDLSRVKHKNNMFKNTKIKSESKKVLMDETHYRKYKQFLRERTEGRRYNNVYFVKTDYNNYEVWDEDEYESNMKYYDDIDLYTIKDRPFDLDNRKAYRVFEEYLTPRERRQAGYDDRDLGGGRRSYNDYIEQRKFRRRSKY